MKYGRSEDIKPKLRQLKRLEEKLRFGGNTQPSGKLVWDVFFNTRDLPTGRSRYSLEQLASMRKEDYKAVVDEYFAYVYYELYKENGELGQRGQYDPDILEKLGLPYDAGQREVKRKFRELAKKYHPDTGGDAAKFIELMEIYRQLTEKG